MITLIPTNVAMMSLDLGNPSVIPSLGGLRHVALVTPSAVTERNRGIQGSGNGTQWHPMDDYRFKATSNVWKAMGELGLGICSQSDFSEFGSLTNESNDEGLGQLLRLGVVRGRYRCKSPST